MDELDECKEKNGFLVSNFDYSVENFLASIDSIKELCGLPGEGSFDASEIERFSSMITFLKEWKYFVYEPKTISFACEADGQVKDDFCGISLPQFSSATVPKMENSHDEARCLDSDFVLHAGGLVWAMDWCPRSLEMPDTSFSCEYIAVAAHPPGSTYHKIGVPLAGRGIIQIWCFLSLEENMEISPRKQRVCTVKPKGSNKNGQAYGLKGKKELTIQRSRGRPKGSYKNGQTHGLKGKGELTIRKPRGRPKGSYKNGQTHGLKGKDELTIRKPRGRPKGSCKKRPYPAVKSLDDNMESVLPGDNLVPSMSNLVPSMSVDSGGTALGMLASSAFNGEVETLVPKRRGRPRKKPTPVLSECVSASENIVAVPVSAYMSNNLESSLGNDRGQPQKKPTPSANKCAEAFGVDPGKYVSALPTSRGPMTFSRSIETPPHFSTGIEHNELAIAVAPTNEDPYQGEMVLSKEMIERPSPSMNECVPASENIVPLPVSVDLNSNLKSSLRRGRGRPRKKPAPSANKCAQAFVTDPVEDVSALPTSRGPRALSRSTTTPPHLSTGVERNELAVTVGPTSEDSYQGEMVLSKEITQKNFRIPKDTALPKVVLCLAHMGKVAWDVKWRPGSVNDSQNKHRLGYLAVLLGNGSLEVWEVPLPSMVKILHTSCHSEGTDPRFLKLKPIFRCSKVQCGDRQSIPLTLEWSPSTPHDLILAGCHDGTVAVWKFSEQQCSQDIKPLLCFSADSVPIRSLAWAPDESDAESANLIVTAGHEGLKIWDIRDPYHPLWEFYPVQRIILSLEWLKDPRCLIMSYDDGELRMLSLWNVANDVLVTGKPSGTMKQAGLHRYPCSHFAIWSVQVSRATGLAAYCTADGSARCFQLTAKAVEKDPGRYREPHFLCGSLTSDDTVFKIITPLSNDPLPNIPWTKAPREMGDAPLYSFLSDANQARRGGDDQTPPVVKSKLKPRCSSNKSSNKKSDPSKPSCQALATEACFTTEADEGMGQRVESSKGLARKLEELPHKYLAMHKVRWNMNKGSEIWLCYGGAAGLIRCQKISLDRTQGRLALK